MKQMRLKTVPAVLFLLLSSACAVSAWSFPRLQNYEAGMDAAGTRFLVHATINGKPAKLALDTGAEGLVLFKPAAERLGLKLSGVPSDTGRQNGKFPVLETKPYDVTLFNTTGKLSLLVADFSVRMDVDGIAGGPLFKNSIFQIDAAGRVVKSLTEVPQEARQWIKLRVRRASDVLCLEIPGPRGNGVILIDTGERGGISLNAERWGTWTNANPNRPKTLTSYYMGGSGVVIGEEAWADIFSLGPLILNNVPVQPASRSDVATGSTRSPYQATLGLTALQRLDFIVDGGAGFAYVRPRTGPFPPYPYNRAGAVFTPRDPGRDKSNELVARVLEGGPAYEAGIRNGDIVLKLGEQWATNWTEGPTAASNKRSAGSKLELLLKRGEKTFNSVVVLRDIFPPVASTTNKQSKAGISK
jgi:hypothetical protein